MSNRHSTVSNRPYRPEFSEAEVRAAIRALDIALSVSKRGVAHGKSISFRPLGSPLAGPDGTETAAARRVLRRFREAWAAKHEMEDSDA